MQAIKQLIDGGHGVHILHSDLVQAPVVHHHAVLTSLLLDKQHRRAIGGRAGPDVPQLQRLHQLSIQLFVLLRTQLVGTFAWGSGTWLNLDHMVHRPLRRQTFWQLFLQHISIVSHDLTCSLLSPGVHTCLVWSGRGSLDSSDHSQPALGCLAGQEGLLQHSRRHDGLQAWRGTRLEYQHPLAGVHRGSA